jgi:uncharacterized protein
LKVGNQYIIPFKGLKTGKHSFDFEIGKEFFEEYKELEIPDGSIHADVVLDRKNNLIVLDINLEGKVKLQCDRCLEFFGYNLIFNGQLFVKFTETPEEPDENVIFLHPNDDLLDLNQYFFDNIGLNIPIQKYHPADSKGNPTCDINMLKILSAHSKEVTLNNDTEIDPRWSKLKDLLNEGNKNE